MNICWLTEKDKIEFQKEENFILVSSIEEFKSFLNKKNNLIFSSDFANLYLEDILNLFSLTTEKFYLFDKDQSTKDLTDGNLKLMFSEKSLHSRLPEDEGKYVTCFDFRSLLDIINS